MVSNKILILLKNSNVNVDIKKTPCYYEYNDGYNKEYNKGYNNCWKAGEIYETNHNK